MGQVLEQITGGTGFYRERKGWESEGWWTVERDKCETVLGKLGDRYYYLYVLSDNDTVWDGKGDEGSTNFCIREGLKFTLSVAAMSGGGDDPNCEKYGYVTKRSLLVDTDRNADYTFNIQD